MLKQKWMNWQVSTEKNIRSTSSLSTGEALMNKDVGTLVLDHGSALPTLLDSGLSFNISDSLSDKDSDIDYLTLRLEISFDDEDQDENAQYLISPEVGVHCDVLKPLGISHQSITLHATESPGDMTDVNLLHGLNSEIHSDHCGIVSDTLINTECISSEESDRNSIPSWRWSSIRRDSTHRMPPHESSGKMQRGNVTWRRKRRHPSVLSCQRTSSETGTVSQTEYRMSTKDATDGTCNEKAEETTVLLEIFQNHYAWGSPAIRFRMFSFLMCNMSKHQIS